MSVTPIIAFENLSFSYDGSAVLENVTFAVTEREFACIVGPNGGGKTTLLKLALGLLKPAQGTVRVFGQSPEQARARIGYMPQNVHLDPKFPVSVLDVVLMGRLGSGRGFGPYRRKDRAAAEQALQDVGLFDLRHRSFSTLSGGQQRLLLIARAIACQPELLLLDEPTANLDPRVEQELYRVLDELNKRLTVVMVSHDLAFVSRFVQKVICVKRRVDVHPTCEIEGGMLSDIFGADVRLVRHDQHSRM